MMTPFARNIPLLAALTLVQALPAADVLNGPMLGHVAMREANVWVQTDAPARLRVAYREADRDLEPLWSHPAQTEADLAHTATLVLPAVEPGKKYAYQVEIDGRILPEEHRFATPAFFHEHTPPPDLRVAVGGSHYVMQDGFEPPYRTLGGGYGVFSEILAAKPDLMLWVGDTAHLRPADWTSRSGYLKRFSTARNLDPLRPLLATVPHYAVWASADYGPPRSGRDYTHRHRAEEAFRAFWPAPSQAASVGGITGRLQRSDVDFFFLDVRSFRNDTPPSTESPVILGEAQIRWLRNELVRSSATFKVIVAGAPILNPAENRDNLSFAENEHTRLLQMLRDERVGGLFFLSGGKPFGELTRLVHANSYNLHDLTVGPLTAAPAEDEDELNYFRMPGTSRFERQFALLDFAGPEENRTLTIRVMSMEGKELWNRTIAAADMRPADADDAR